MNETSNYLWLRLTPDEALRLPLIDIDPARATSEPMNVMERVVANLEERLDAAERRA